MQRCEALARHSELPGGLTRVFLSPENRAANELVIGWMREAGMEAKLDAIGNVAGRYEGNRPGLPCLGVPRRPHPIPRARGRGAGAPQLTPLPTSPSPLR